jgi:undecaprenyl diphosphate synthase
MKKELKHIAIIMDGNGRWAEEKGLNRNKGHAKGADVVKEITIFASKNSIEYLTLYTFSTENWQRPKIEVNFLMKLLENWLKKELNLYLEHNVKFETIGDLSKLPKSTQKVIQYTKDKTKEHNGLTQILAINYGSQDEIVRTIQKLDNRDDLTIEKFNKLLDTGGIPDVDILVRTGGEKRLSNFLLWQLSYAEIFFLNIMWPDFKKGDLEDVITDFYKIERRFGKLPKEMDKK